MAGVKGVQISKDAAATPAQFNYGMWDSSGSGAGPWYPIVYFAEPGADAVVDVRNSAPSTTGGVSTYSFQGGTGNALMTNSPVAATAGAHSLYGFDFFNETAADIFIQVFDVAAVGVTLGTTVPKLSYKLPAGAGLVINFGSENRVAFATAITFAATATANGAGAPAAGLRGNVYFK